MLQPRTTRLSNWLITWPHEGNINFSPTPNATYSATPEGTQRLAMIGYNPRRARSQNTGLVSIMLGRYKMQINGV